MANYVDQINLNGNVADLKGVDSDHYYAGVDLTQKFASEIANYSDVWQWIKARIRAQDFSKIHVADYIPVTCTNNNRFNARIAGINTYKGYGDTAVGNHIDFISASLWPTTFKMNLVNFNNGLDANHPYPWLVSNGYHFINSLAGSVPNGTGNMPATEGVDYTEGGIYYFLPDALKAVIVEKRMYLAQRFSASGIQQQDTAGGWVDIGKLWLPTEFEVAGAKIGNDSRFAAMSSVQYPLFANNMNRMIGRANWWSISTFGGNSTYFVIFNANGFVTYASASSAYRGPVCFRISA